MKIIIFDTETTGLPRDYNAPTRNTDNWPRMVQLAYQKIDLIKNKCLESKNFIIKPDGYEISPELTKIHGISQEMALSEGNDVNIVLGAFLSDLWGCKYVIGHNVSFDIGILGAEMVRSLGIDILSDKIASGELRSYCTMKKAKEQGIFGGHYGGYPKLKELYHHFFKEDFDGAHNALNDVQACKKCFFELIKKK